MSVCSLVQIIFTAAIFFILSNDLRNAKHLPAISCYMALMLPNIWALETWVVSINRKSQKSKSSQTEQNTAAVRSEKGSLVSQGGGAVEFSQTFWGTAICCRNFSCNLPAFRSVTSFRFPPTFLSRSVQWQWHFGRTPNAGNAPEIE